MSWISVKHSLPPEEKEVLLFSEGFIIIGHWAIRIPDFDDKGKIYKGKKSKILWYESHQEYGSGNDRKVTHWMSLPERPDELD